MDLNYRTIPLFPSCVHLLDIDNFENYRDQLIKEIYEDRDNDPMGRELSNRGGWQSIPYRIEKSRSQLLKRIIIDSLMIFEPMAKKGVMAVEGWTNINRQGDFNVRHNHPNCHLSGVLWIKIPDESSKFRFTNPMLFQRWQELEHYTSEFKAAWNVFPTYHFTPKEGRLMLFPSDLDHEVLQNESEEDRISYSFNINIFSDRINKGKQE